MKNIARPLIVSVTTLLSVSAGAQFVAGNEAVHIGPTGRWVERPPVLASYGAPCAASANCHAGAWRMVETDSGLMECTEATARPTSCRASSYGTVKLPRVWVVKQGAVWLQCQYPDLKSVCKPMHLRPPANLPLDAIQ